MDDAAFDSLPSQREVTVSCPFCGQRISVLIDPSAGEQSYIEDCSVCCRPIQFSVHCEHGELDRVDANRGD
ncbi:MAG: CPXCG motif-containing cysteine-rich protein [Deltaproteobacteria bacterium]|nr:CPXCG motif-containing cysteine-rich protein [Deltaproteobacteria bacterium]MBI3294930.1 CPXCG motif-containing cysteine-rich protein [Deltaproteobacteria bacterium]